MPRKQKRTSIRTVKTENPSVDQNATIKRPKVSLTENKVVKTAKDIEPNKFEADVVKEEFVETRIEKKIRVKKLPPIGFSAEQLKSRDTIGKRVLAAAGNSRKMLGMHVSAAGSLDQAVYNALAIGCRAFALFIRNQRTWNAIPLTDAVVERFQTAIKEQGFPLEMIVPHGSYLLNLGSSDALKLEKSRSCLLDECRRCERLGILMYNFHPGSACGGSTKEECLKTVAESINWVIEQTETIVLVIETMAGQGHSVGGTFEEIRAIIDLVKNKERVGVCIDTCHIFAGGYDIRNKAVYDKTMAHFERVIGFKYLKAVHLNDSKGALGSHLDRHDHIGKGLIGTAGFELLMNDARFNGIPMVLEVPEGDEPEEIIFLHNLEVR